MHWLYQRPKYNVRFQQQGGYGNEINQVFENLKGSLELYPAQTIASTTRVNLVDGGQLVVANSGTNGVTTTREVSMNQVVPDAFKSSDDEGRISAIPENDTHFKYISKLKGTGMRIPLLDCENSGVCPGYGGRGTYLLLNSTAGLEYMDITSINNTVYRKDYGKSMSGSRVCDKNDVLSNYPGNSSVRICTGKTPSGGRGAVVLIW